MATRTVVFDMDGTLVQTRAASWDVFQDTARRFELHIRSAEEFFELFRGNFYEALKALCGDPAVEAAVREHFLQGMRERYAPRFIPGMRDVVKSLAARYPLAVMSSNAMGAIRRILENEGLAHCFAHVFSGEVGESKEAHLRWILDEPSYGDARHCSPSYVEGTERDAAEVVLITDTVGDIRAATSCGVRAIGVAWGMHSSDALLQAGAESVALWPQEILATLLTLDDGASGESCRCAVAGSCRPSPVDADRPPNHTGAHPHESGAGLRPVAAARGWPWPAVIAAGEQRRRRRASSGSAAARASSGSAAARASGGSVAARASGGSAAARACGGESVGSPAIRHHPPGVAQADAALAAAVHRISRRPP
jgi:phosphoglycolate phosphatase